MKSGQQAVQSAAGQRGAVAETPSEVACEVWYQSGVSLDERRRRDGRRRSTGHSGL